MTSPEVWSLAPCHPPLGCSFNYMQEPFRSFSRRCDTHGAGTRAVFYCILRTRSRLAHAAEWGRVPHPQRKRRALRKSCRKVRAKGRPDVHTIESSSLVRSSREEITNMISNLIHTYTYSRDRGDDCASDVPRELSCLSSLSCYRPSPDYVLWRCIATGQVAHPCRSHPHDLET